MASPDSQKSTPTPSPAQRYNENQDDPRTSPPTSLEAPISPPPIRSAKHRKTHEDEPSAPNLAAIEAGETAIDDHLAVFSEQLSRRIRPMNIGPRGLLPIDEFRDLYARNQRRDGRHFVVHQHDHPVAGVHYDLRLQISESSSISFAIMYGLPGNPNSRRLNRNATETRVHNLWNHLIETASPHTGSLLIWDTGEYSVLPYHTPSSPQTSSSSSASSSDYDSASPSPGLSESQKLHIAFRNRKIRLRLHGHRLPENYTISLRILPDNNRTAQPSAPVRKRRRKKSNTKHSHYSTSESDSEPEALDDVSGQQQENEEDEQIRLSNAYPGAINSIESIHQRRWFLSMDRVGSGFSPVSNPDGTKAWRRLGVDTEMVRGETGEGDDEGFVVLGRDVERSIVTGRTAEEVMADEGVEGFVGRRGWRGVVE